MGRFVANARLAPGVTRPACERLKWGDPLGHARHGERLCEVCAVKGRAHQSLYRLRRGETSRFSLTDLRRLTEGFVMAYDPGSGDAFEAAFTAGLERAVLSR